MHALLERLGIPADVQSFFNASADLIFSYGDQQEHYHENFHKVPSTRNLFAAGEMHAAHVIISCSVMEAMAFLTLNKSRFPRLGSLAVIATGTRFYHEQACWIRQNFAKRKFTLVFGNDLTGHVTAVKMAASILGRRVRAFYSGEDIVIHLDNIAYAFKQERFTLHAFQEATGLRPRFRAPKPVHSFTFLDQLKHDTER